MRRPSPPLFRAAPSVVLGALLLAAVPIAACAAPARYGGESVAPPDLRLEWTEDDGVRGNEEHLEGRAGETIRVRYRLRNVGGTPAFATVIGAHTALGPQGEAERLQPGPAAGVDLERHLDLPLAVGMREVCVEAALQNRSADDPRDPHHDDNRLCRKLRVQPLTSEATSPSEEKNRCPKECPASQPAP